MTTSQMTDAERMAQLDDRLTPKRVDLSLHGGSHTLTYLLDGRYFTVERIRPDFPRVADDAELRMKSSADAKLRARRQEIDRQTREARCEQYLIEALLTNGMITFGVEFQSYLRVNHLDDTEPTNRSYYDAKKAFVTVWLRLTAIIAGE
jgi:hypothetical protein